MDVPAHSQMSLECREIGMRMTMQHANRENNDMWSDHDQDVEQNNHRTNLILRNLTITCRENKTWTRLQDEQNGTKQTEAEKKFFFGFNREDRGFRS